MLHGFSLLIRSLLLTQKLKNLVTRIVKQFEFKMTKFHTLVLFCVLLFLCHDKACLGDNMDEKMNMMEGDIMGIAPSLLESDMGSTNKAHWPGNQVPYVFQRGYPEDLKRLFHQAVKHIAARTCIKFVPRSNQKDYVNVISDAGCYSYVGRIGNAQQMSLPRPCAVLGIFVHEMLHAVGFSHEQSRYDRDNYVTIRWNNIRPETFNNFRLKPMQLASRYDYYSVMHYSGDAFTKNGQDTIVPKYKGIKIGQRKGMSRGDIAEIKQKFCS